MMASDPASEAAALACALDCVLALCIAGRYAKSARLGHGPLHANRCILVEPDGLGDLANRRLQPLGHLSGDFE
jgi:hypothetical protein